MNNGNGPAFKRKGRKVESEAEAPFTWFICKYCKKVFPSQTVLSLHKRRLHKFQVVEADGRKLFYNYRDGSVLFPSATKVNSNANHSASKPQSLVRVAIQGSPPPPIEQSSSIANNTTPNKRPGTATISSHDSTNISAVTTTLSDSDPLNLPPPTTEIATQTAGTELELVEKTSTGQQTQEFIPAKPQKSHPKEIKRKKLDGSDPLQALQETQVKDSEIRAPSPSTITSQIQHFLPNPNPTPPSSPTPNKSNNNDNDSRAQQQCIKNEITFFLASSDDERPTPEEAPGFKKSAENPPREAIVSNVRASANDSQRPVLPRCSPISFDLDLDLHPTVTFDPEVEKEYKCNKCPRIFKTIGSLRRHNYSHLRHLMQNKAKQKSHSQSLKLNAISNRDAYSPNPSSSSSTVAVSCQGNYDGGSNRVSVIASNYNPPVAATKDQRPRDGAVSYSGIGIGDLMAGKYSGLSLQRIERRENPAPTFACLLCHLTFQGKETLADHLRSHMSLGQLAKSQEPPPGNISDRSPGKFLCQICARSFKNQHELDEHGGRQRVCSTIFTCSFCFLPFPTGEALRSHEKTHGGPTPFRCKFCGAPFKSVATLMAHLVLHS